MRPRSETSRLLTAIVLGALVFATGLALARAFLPEWRAGDLPSRASLAASYRALAARAGVRLVPGEPKVLLTTAGVGDRGWLPCRGMDTEHGTFSPLCTEVRLELMHKGTQAGDRQLHDLEISFAANREPRAVQWRLSDSNAFIIAAVPSVAEGLVAAFARLLLRRGESLGPAQRLSVLGNLANAFPLQGARPAAHIVTFAPIGGAAFAERRPGRPSQSVEVAGESSSLTAFFLHLAGRIAPVLAVAGLFLVLLSRRRIDVVNAALLAAVAFVAVLPATLARMGPTAADLPLLLLPMARALWVFLLWSTGESLLRTADPGFTTSLDALRAGRLGPRGGRALLSGLALGAAAAGVSLAVYAAAAALRGLWPESASLALPVLAPSHDPFGDGITLAGCLLVLLAASRRLLQPRWALPLAILAGALLLEPLQIHPYPTKLAASAALLALFVLFGRRTGVTALLTAAIASLLLPAAAFSGLHAGWLPGTFAATAGTLAGFLLLGLLGLARPAQVEAERLRAPAFMRRIEEERRIKYEMDLLARMQEGLLPRSLPELSGWQIAARSILATEAGGDLYDFLIDEEGKLWVAAGDVAGHGYSCAIVQAMTTAALSSLISPERTPSEVLQGVDRVIRRGGSPRNFTSLSLLRLDPATGEGVLANAGHPYPLLLTGGQAAEIPLPGLPLGQGPPREYRDLVFQLPPGGALVLFSDGLIETHDGAGREVPYGFERPSVVLLESAHATAQEMLDALLADWRRHLGSGEPPDDTTVVVVKRIDSCGPGGD